jgi:hypothetical protein
MCKEMQVSLVDRVVDKKRIIGKIEGQGGGEAQGVAETPKTYPNGKFQITTKYTKCPKNIPNGCKVCRPNVHKICQYLPSQDTPKIPKFGFFV